MDLTLLRNLLLWCTVINYALLISWFLIAYLAHDWMCRICGRLFRVSPAQVEHLNFVGISVYKLAVILFNLVPLLALLIVAK